MEFNSDNAPLHQSSGDDTSLNGDNSSTEEKTIVQIHANEEICENIDDKQPNGSLNNSNSHLDSPESKSVWMSAFGDTLPSKCCSITKKGDSVEYLEESFSNGSCNISQIVANGNVKGGQKENFGDHVGRFWFSNFSKIQLLTLFSICLVQFTSSMGMSIMAPFFPMEASEKGLDDALIGFVFSNYAVVMFIMSPIFGRVLPIIGPHFLFFSGLFLSAGCTILFGALEYLSGSMFLYFCFVVRSLEAFGAAAFNTAACTIVAQIFPDNVSGVFGLTETFVGLGMTMGPAVGGALYSLGTFSLPFYSLGAFMMVMIPINMWLLPKEQTSDVTVKSGSMLRLLKLPVVIIMISVTLVQATAWSFIDPFLQPHLSDFNLSSEMVGLVFLMLSATYGIFCPIFGWVADTWDHTRIMMTIGMCLTSLSLLLIGPSDFFPFLDNTLWLNIVALILLGFATPMAEIPTFQGIMDCAIDSGFDDDLGTYSLVAGIWSAAFSFGEFLGPAAGGVLVTSSGFPLASTVIAAVVLIPIIFIIVYEIGAWCSRNDIQHNLNLPPKIAPIATESTPLLKSL